MSVMDEFYAADEEQCTHPLSEREESLEVDPETQEMVERQYCNRCGLAKENF